MLILEGFLGTGFCEEFSLTLNSLFFVCLFFCLCVYEWCFFFFVFFLCLVVIVMLQNVV